MDFRFTFNFDFRFSSNFGFRLSFSFNFDFWLRFRFLFRFQILDQKSRSILAEALAASSSLNDALISKGTSQKATNGVNRSCALISHDMNAYAPPSKP